MVKLIGILTPRRRISGTLSTNTDKIILNDDYEKLRNKPYINEIEVEGYKDGGEYNLQNRLIPADDSIELVDDPDSHTTSIRAKGAGGNRDYNDLSNKPSLNGNTVVGDKSSQDYGLQDRMNVATIAEIEAILYLD